jgi:hypothetical protein
VDGNAKCEIHQLIGGKHPIISRVSTIRNWWCRISQPSTVCIYICICAYTWLG